MTDTIATAFIAEAMSKGFDKLEQDFLKLSETEQRAVIDMMEAQAQATAKIQSEMERRVSIITQKEAEIRKQFDYTAQSSLKLGAAFGGVAAAGVAFIGSATQLAARVETLGVVTARIGANLGMTEQQVRTLEASIQDLGITTQGSRQALAMMAQANLDLSRATDLARLAQDAAVVTGENSTDTFQQLVYAISSGSVIMLRRMMLSADFEAAYKREADAIGKTTLELTEAQKTQIRMNEVLERGKNISGVYGAAMETAGKKITSLARHLEEARVSIGEAFLPMYADLIDTVTGSLKSWNDLDESWKRGISTTGGLVVAIAAVESAVFVSIGTFMKMRAAMEAANQMRTIAGVGFGTFATAIALPVAALTALSLISYAQAKASNESYESITAAGAAALLAAANYDEYANAVLAAAEAEGKYVDSQGKAKPTERGYHGYENVYAPQVVAAPEEFTATRFEAGAAEEETAIRQRMAAWAEERRAAEEHTTDLNEQYQKRTNNLRVAAAEQARWNAIGAEAMKAMAQEELNALTMEAGLAAGIRGQLAQVTEQYVNTIEDLRWQEGELVKDLDLANEKYGEGSEKVADLTHKLDENREKQIAAANAMKEATSQMIYQQAAAGLDAGAALELARAMGILSEQDYAVAAAIQTLRGQFDENGDGMIDASEDAEAYAARVAEIDNVVRSLQDAGIDVTAQNIAEGMEAIEETGSKMTPEWMAQIVAGEEDTVAKLGNVEEGIGNIATTAETSAATTATHMGGIQESAGLAEEGFTTAKTAVDLFKQSIDLLPNEKTITITVNYVKTGPEFQHGGSFVVPPGFNNDNFPLFVSSGERVVVQPRGQHDVGSSRMGGVSGIGGGNVEGDNYVFNNFSRGAASHSMALVRAAKAKRLNQSMGSPV